MSDRLLEQEDIEAMCLCRGATKDAAFEIQRPSEGGWQTLAYGHIDCPLHGITRYYKRPAPEFKRPDND